MKKHYSKEMVYPPLFPHDPISKIFENVYLVRGSIKIGPGMRMNRNMLIVKDADELTLINPVRLDDQELRKLEALGTVRHVMRLGDFHGLDDQFYMDRYQPAFWCQAGQSTYKSPEPTHVIHAGSNPPVADAEFFLFEAAKFPEAALFLRKQKLLITTDSLQYWTDWRYTSIFTRFVLRLMGFRFTLFIGGPWLKRVAPAGSSLVQDFERLAALDFDHVVAAHGSLLQNDAKPLLKAAIAKTFGKTEKWFQPVNSACG